MSDGTSHETIPIEWLAAYADAQLDPVLRSRVEAWLLEHPEALADLEKQQLIAESDFRKAIAPPMPVPDTWERVFSNIEDAVAKDARRAARLRRIGYLVPAMAIASFAAALLVAFLAVDRQHLAGLHPLPVELLHPDGGKSQMFTRDDGDEFVFPVAGADDVELIHLPESVAELLVVGKHPLADVLVLLAQASDVQLLNYGPDDQGNLPDIQTTQGPDASMLWAPSQKP